MSKRSDDAFFIGWAAAPSPLRWFMLVISIGLVVLFGFTAYVIAATQADPGSGAPMGRANVTGILEAGAYPVVHVVESDRFQPGQVLLLSGNGKRGVQERAEPLDGQLVQIAGGIIHRGDISMIRLFGG
ncbi:MAG: hypothetical protein AAF414_24365, partial [Pseudomonadota bacterium]